MGLGLIIVIGIAAVIGIIILDGFLSGTDRKKTKQIVRKPPKAPDPFKPTTKVPAKTTESPSIYIDTPGFLGTGPVSPALGGGWILNPASTFPLTISGISQAIAAKLKDLLDEGSSLGTDAHARSIFPIIALSNLRCKEIDDYIERFRPQYLEKIEQLKQTNPEWTSASPEDQEDLLEEFSQEAIDSLDIRPYGEPDVLFECEPANVAVDESLILRYANESLFFYLRFAENLEKIHNIPADHYLRSEFEKLVRLGLASNAKTIPSSAILGTLKLRELNELTGLSNQRPFRTKEKASEFLMQLPHLDRRIAASLKPNDLFQLNPLPEGLSLANFSATSGAWDYVNQVSLLIAHTYVMGELASQHVYSNDEIPNNILWKVLPAEDACPFCKRAASSRAQRAEPKVPLHIGCRCTVTPEVRW